MENFKIRCSAIGQLMTNDRSGKNMGKTAYSYIEQWVKEQLYNRRKEFYSKQTDKGLTVENDAIQFAAEQENWGMVFKNEQHFESEFLTGTPDVILADKVIDIKSSWDCFTFPLFENIIDKSYWWQLQGYMILTGKPKAELIYCLMDMPLHLLEREFNYKRNELGLIELEPEQEEEIISKNTYSHLPAFLRIKKYEIEKDAEAEKAIIERVKIARGYINQLKF